MEARRLADIAKRALDTSTAQKFCRENSRLPMSREDMVLPDGTVISVGRVVAGAKHPECDLERRRHGIFMQTITEFRAWKEGYDKRDVPDQRQFDTVLDWFDAHPCKMPHKKEQVELNGGRVVNVGLLVTRAKRGKTPKESRLRSILLEKVPAFQEYVKKTEVGEIDRINRPHSDKPTSRRIAVKDFVELHGLPSYLKGAIKMQNGVNVFSYIQIHKRAYSGTFAKNITAKEKALSLVDIAWLRTNVTVFDEWCIKRADVRANKRQKLE